MPTKHHQAVPPLDTKKTACYSELTEIVNSLVGSVIVFDAEGGAYTIRLRIAQDYYTKVLTEVEVRLDRIGESHE